MSPNIRKIIDDTKQIRDDLKALHKNHLQNAEIGKKKLLELRRAIQTPSRQTPSMRLFSRRAIQTPSRQTPSRQTPSMRLFSSQAPLSQAPLSQAPLSQAPLSQAPLSQAPLSQAPLRRLFSRQTPSMHTPLTHKPLQTDTSDKYIILLTKHNNLRLDFLKIINDLIAFFTIMGRYKFNAKPSIDKLKGIKGNIDTEYKKSLKYVSDTYTIQQTKKYRELFLQIIECIYRIPIPTPTDKTLSIYSNTLKTVIPISPEYNLRTDNVASLLDEYVSNMEDKQHGFNVKLNLHRNILYHILTEEFIKFNALFHYIFKYINYLALLLNNPINGSDINHTVESITNLQHSILFSQTNAIRIIDEYNKLITASKSLGALKGFELTESELKELNNIKKEESYYILETKQKNVMENVDNNDIPDFDDDEIYGGRRKPKKKPTNATMNMKDIKRLCKANQIKLSKTKDGIRIIYTKKELITKLKRKKIL